MKYLQIVKQGKFNELRPDNWVFHPHPPILDPSNPAWAASTIYCNTLLDNSPFYWENFCHPTRPLRMLYCDIMPFPLVGRGWWWAISCRAWSRQATMVNPTMLRQVAQPWVGWSLLHYYHVYYDSLSMLTLVFQVMHRKYNYITLHAPNPLFCSKMQENSGVLGHVFFQLFKTRILNWKLVSHLFKP